MIDIERCHDCPRVAALVDRGIGQAAINALVQTVNYGEGVGVHPAPTRRPGGWVGCNAEPRIQNALEGAAALAALTTLTIELK